MAEFEDVLSAMASAVKVYDEASVENRAEFKDNVRKWADASLAAVEEKMRNSTACRLEMKNTPYITIINDVLLAVDPVCRIVIGINAHSTRQSDEELQDNKKRHIVIPCTGARMDAENEENAFCRFDEGLERRKLASIRESLGGVSRNKKIGSVGPHFEELLKIRKKNASKKIDPQANRLSKGRRLH